MADATVHRHVRDAAPRRRRAVNTHAAWLRGLAQMGPTALQRAIILKEVLGPPLALQQDPDSRTTL
jgi:hypothetical protein